MPIGPLMRGAEARRTAEFVTVRYTPPGGPSQNIGVLLLVRNLDLLLMKFRDDWSGLDEDAKEILSELSASFVALSQSLSPHELVSYIEDNWSHTITVSGRTPIEIGLISDDKIPDNIPELQQLFDQYVLGPSP
jgi:hypothetical protein